MFITRHGVSCANVTSKLATERGWNVFGRLSHDAAMYLRRDPELTAFGRVKAQRMGRHMKRLLEKEVGDRPIVVGASRLLRAQQTAYYMLQPNEVVIVPYISEVGPSGDNYPVSPSEQATILRTQTCGWPDFSAQRNFSYFDAAPDAGTPHPGNFINWLQETYSHLVRLHGGLGTPLFFVSHGGFIRHLIFHVMAGEYKDNIHWSLFGSDRKHGDTKREKHLLEQYLNNYRAFKFDVTIFNIDSVDPARRPSLAVTNVTYLPYEWESANNYVDNTKLQTAQECEIDTCRYPVCRSSRVEQAETCSLAQASPSLLYRAVVRYDDDGPITPRAIDQAVTAETRAGTPYAIGGRTRTRKRKQQKQRKQRRGTRKGR